MAGKLGGGRSPESDLVLLCDGAARLGTGVPASEGDDGAPASRGAMTTAPNVGCRESGGAHHAQACWSIVSASP
jgi:hypothetical protein